MAAHCLIPNPFVIMNYATPKIPTNETERLINLAEYDIDYDSVKQEVEGLTQIAARIANMPISFINIIDAHTQWTISDYGMVSTQCAREDSGCKYTIRSSNHLEVPDMRVDPRFSDLPSVKEAELVYYWGTPLQTPGGFNIGTLCLLDYSVRHLDVHTQEILALMGAEVVKRLGQVTATNRLRQQLFEAQANQRKLGHDVRSPVSGIVNVAEILEEELEKIGGRCTSLTQYTRMIHQSGQSLIDVANDFLRSETATQQGDGREPMFTQVSLREKLYRLYMPQAVAKRIGFEVNTDPQTERTPFVSGRLLQVAGNLIANAIKYTPENGRVVATLALDGSQEQSQLFIKVADTGIGISTAAINAIQRGETGATNGTAGEQGFGLGLTVVKHLVDQAGGQLKIQALPGVGSTFLVTMPV